ncbi:efflux transporter periplasmic adaptor subunit [Marinomonas sp. 42_23_T18]|nr:efflux transporter periplasmic adaptor subunit [Marinomonas sp. 42_23_T18]
MTSSSLKLLSTGAILATSLLISACSPEQESTQIQETVVRPVKLVTVSSNIAHNIRSFPAELKASKEANLAFRVGGQLNQLVVTSGQVVKKGQLLASLDPTDFKLDLELAKADYRFAKSNFDRTKSTYEKKVSSRASYEASRASLDQAENALQRAKNKLSYTRLYAPFDGVIADVETENFQYINATQSLIHFQDNKSIDVEFHIPESLIANIQASAVNYKPNVIINVLNNKVYKAHYKEYSTTPDDETKTYEITMGIERDADDSARLLPGMTADVVIDLGLLINQTQNILLPVEAIFETTTAGNSPEQKVWVYDASNQRAVMRKVEVGSLQGDRIVIISGLKEGEQVIAAGVHSLTSDTKVRPWVRERGL